MRAQCILLCPSMIFVHVCCQRPTSWCRISKLVLQSMCFHVICTNAVNAIGWNGQMYSESPLCGMCRLFWNHENLKFHCCVDTIDLRYLDYLGSLWVGFQLDDAINTMIFFMGLAKLKWGSYNCENWLVVQVSGP